MYSASSYGKNVLFQSSSGGVFYELAQHYLKSLNVVVYCCIIVDSEVFHKRITDSKDIFSLAKSKYVLSNVKNTFKQCSTDLNNSLSVLYVALPCQIAALKNYLDINKICCEKLLIPVYI